MSKLTVKNTLIYITLSVLFIAQGNYIKAQNQVAKKISQNEIPSKLFGLTIDESSLDEQLLKMDALKLIENILEKVEG